MPERNVEIKGTAGDLLAMFLVILCFMAVAVVAVFISASDHAKWDQREQLRQQYVTPQVVQTVQLSTQP